ncbi:MAG: hypothetical protein MZV70_46585 [Desulfobacterales bacterium]|nr:hypothetical protein [Desulfobacterales bacterium]
MQKYSDGSQDVYGIAVSPDGNLLAIGQQDGDDHHCGRSNRKKKLRTLSGHAGLVARLAFSQDGSRLASASFDRLAKVWDVATGEELSSPYGNTGNVFSVSFSPDGDTPRHCRSRWNRPFIGASPGSTEKVALGQTRCHDGR